MATNGHHATQNNSPEAMAEGPIHQPQQTPSRYSFVIDAIFNMRNDKFV